jgi:hypothetical protein
MGEKDRSGDQREPPRGSRIHHEWTPTCPNVSPLWYKSLKVHMIQERSFDPKKKYSIMGMVKMKIIKMSFS